MLYGTDALKDGRPADVVVLPGNTLEVANIATLCHESQIPLTPRGAGTGYSGGAVPIHGGVVIALDRFDRILEIDKANLLAVVQPNVVNGTLQKAVESQGLFYPPDPASLSQSVLGGNVAECAGGPRAFKYGTTKRYVLGLEAVLPTGEIIRTGGRTVKNVVGYDLTQLLVGSEGTLAIVTEIILRLLPKPPDSRTLRAVFPDVETAIAATLQLTDAGVIPAALELLDRNCLELMAEVDRALLSPKSGAVVLLVEVDGTTVSVEEEMVRVHDICRQSNASDIRVANDVREMAVLWQVRRDLSLELRKKAPRKINHDVVVPRSSISLLLKFVDALCEQFKLRVACFGHVGDGNIHVNFLVDPANKSEMDRALIAEARLFEKVVALDGSISGEHGIGFTKSKYVELELSRETIDVMRRVKKAFDPNGILNPGKIFSEKK